MKQVAVIIPALDEGATIERVIDALPKALIRHVIVVDGGSRDDTVERARAAGARVVSEPRPGYGRACLTGLDVARERGAEVVAFIDGALAEAPPELARVLLPILFGEADLVIGSRTRGPAERGALRPLQRAGNLLATTIIWLRFGHRYSDLGSMRAVRRDALDALEMTELAHGWPVEMQVKALKAGLRVLEVPVSYRVRRHGRSKVSGSLRGALRAGLAILWVLSREGP